MQTSNNFALSTFQGIALFGIGVAFTLLLFTFSLRGRHLIIVAPWEDPSEPRETTPEADAGASAPTECRREDASRMLIAWLNDGRVAGGGDPRADAAIDYALAHGQLCHMSDSGYDMMICDRFAPDTAPAPPTDPDDPFARDVERVNFQINCDPEADAWFSTYDEVMDEVTTLHLPPHSGSYRLTDAIRLIRVLYQIQHQTHYYYMADDFRHLPWLETVCRNAQAGLTSLELELDLYDRAADGALRPFVHQDLLDRHARGDYSIPSLDDVHGAQSIDRILGLLPDHTGTLSSTEIYHFYRLEEFEIDHTTLGERLTYAAMEYQLFGNVPWDRSTLPTENCP
jgi:hypothetical protein